MNRLLYGICVMFVLGGVGGALTVRGQAQTRVINNDKGVAVQGYDVVAYFTGHAAVKGSAQYAHTWNGVEWWFASPEHRDLFFKEPSVHGRGGFPTHPIHHQSERNQCRWDNDREEREENCCLRHGWRDPWMRCRPGQIHDRDEDISCQAEISRHEPRDLGNRSLAVGEAQLAPDQPNRYQN